MTNNQTNSTISQLIVTSERGTNSTPRVKKRWNHDTLRALCVVGRALSRSICETTTRRQRPFKSAGSRGTTIIISKLTLRAVHSGSTLTVVPKFGRPFERYRHNKSALQRPTLVEDGKISQLTRADCNRLLATYRPFCTITEVHDK